MLEKINTLLNMTKSKKRETSANDNVVNDTLIDEIDNDDNDDNESTSSESLSDKQLRRRKPKKHSRVNHNTQLLHTEFEDISSEPNKICKGCSPETQTENNEIDIQSKLQTFEAQYEKLKTSYINIETEMFMVYVLFFTIAPYLLFAGIRYDNKALVSIAIVLLLYAITNLFMFLWE
jgi:hypothetical protein